MGWDNSEFFLHCLPGLPGRTEPRCPPYTAVSVFWRDITPLICLTSLLPSRCYLVTSRINHLHSDSGLRCASRVPRSRQQDLESATPPEAGVRGSPCPCPWFLSLVKWTVKLHGGRTGQNSQGLSFPSLLPSLAPGGLPGPEHVCENNCRWRVRRDLSPGS